MHHIIITFITQATVHANKEDTKACRAPIKCMSIIWPGRSLGFVGLSAVGDDPGLGARLAAAVLLPPHVVDNVLLRRLQCEMREKIAIKI